MTPVAPDDEPRFRALMDEHHCHGAPSKIGRIVWNAADDGAFPAPVPRCGARDAWIGWGRREQFGWLHLIANNGRLLLPRRRPNLGSRFLALCAWRISPDWQSRHRHPLLLLKTFADPNRFCRDHGRDQGAGIAVERRTIRGAVDDEGRQTRVLGASTHGASAPPARKNRSGRHGRRG